MAGRAFFRWGGRILGGALVLVLLGAASAYGVSERRGHAKYDVPEHTITVVSDSATIARGAHLATIRGCNECHAPNMGGRVMVDDPAIGRLVSTNLTNGRKGGALSDRDWERAVRHGVRGDSTPLTVMPAHEFTGFADEDLAAIIGWTRSLPSVSDSLPTTRVGPLGRALHAAGELVLYPAERIDHEAVHPVRVVPAPDAPYGKYMAAGCIGCHGATYSAARSRAPRRVASGRESHADGDDSIRRSELHRRPAHRKASRRDRDPSADGPEADGGDDRRGAEGGLGLPQNAPAQGDGRAIGVATGNDDEARPAGRALFTFLVAVA